MIIPFTFFFGVVGYLYYRSKDEVDLVERDQLYYSNEIKEEDDLYDDLEDLFI